MANMHVIMFFSSLSIFLIKCVQSQTSTNACITRNNAYGIAADAFNGNIELKATSYLTSAEYESYDIAVYFTFPHIIYTLQHFE